MNILEVSNYFPEHPGGIEFVALNLVTRWRARHRVRWMACDVKDRPHSAAPDDIPLPAWNFAEERLGFPYPVPLGDSAVRILREVRDCDVVHIHDCLYLASVIAFLASRQHRKPLLVTQHVGPVPYAEAYKNLLQRLAYASLSKLVLGRAEQVVFISERVKRWFEARVRFRRPPQLIPNGVDSRLFYPAGPEERKVMRERLGIPQDKPTLLFVGRFTQKKGLHIIHELAQTHPGWKWILVGQGEIDPRHWQLANVEVVSPVPQADLRQYYTAADALILPSSGEGVPLALQEALACGLPAIVSDEIAGYFPDAPLTKLSMASLPEMKQTIESFFHHPDSLATMRSAAVLYAKQWAWDSVAKAYENILSNVSGCTIDFSKPVRRI